MIAYFAARKITCSTFTVMINEECHKHCVKIVPAWRYSGPYFPAFSLNMERYSVSLRIQSECWTIQARITPNTDTFHVDQVKAAAVIFRRRLFQNSHEQGSGFSV